MKPFLKLTLNTNRALVRVRCITVFVCYKIVTIQYNYCWCTNNMYEWWTFQVEFTSKKTNKMTNNQVSRRSCLKSAAASKLSYFLYLFVISKSPFSRITFRQRMNDFAELGAMLLFWQQNLKSHCFGCSTHFARKQN